MYLYRLIYEGTWRQWCVYGGVKGIFSLGLTQGMPGVMFIFSISSIHCQFEKLQHCHPAWNIGLALLLLCTHNHPPSATPQPPPPLVHQGANHLLKKEFSITYEWW